MTCAEMNDYYMKRAPRKWRGTIFFDAGRGERPSLPLPPPAYRYGGQPPATAGAGLKCLSRFGFPWNA